MSTALDGEEAVECADDVDSDGRVLGSGWCNATEGRHGGLLHTPVIFFPEAVCGGSNKANFIAEFFRENLALKGESLIRNCGFG
jgi:hypothetical protein